MSHVCRARGTRVLHPRCPSAEALGFLIPRSRRGHERATGSHIDRDVPHVGRRCHTLPYEAIPSSLLKFKDSQVP